jgi:hypothetical protein
MRALRHTVPLLALTALLFLLALGASCSSGTAGSASTQSTVGPAGGAVTLQGQGIQLVIPAGALSADVAVVLRATSLSSGVRVSIEPDQLALARVAILSVQFQGPVHIASVDELRGGSQWPLGVVSRVETASSAQVQVLLDHFAQVEVDLGDTLADGGPIGCCGPDGCDALEGGQGHGDSRDEDDGGHACDGGFDDDYTGRDAGLKILLGCPSGFECDDGVCVTPGGNDEEKPCDDVDAGLFNVCPLFAHCEERRCLPDLDDAGFPLGPYCDVDAGMTGVCPLFAHCEERRCLPDHFDGGTHLGGGQD